MQEIPANFQRLAAEDEVIYGTPAFIYLAPPDVDDPLCVKKKSDWIAWRGAPYEAERHSEYLYIPERDADKGPKILVSAVMPAPSNIEMYIQSISSKRRYDIQGKKATKLGYTADVICPASRASEIWGIIHSCSSRQGRQIAPLYLNRPPDHDFSSYKPYNNPHYDDICCGVFSPSGQLAAYLLGKRVGHHVQYDEIMGHAEHLHNDVMYLLHIKFLEICSQLPVPPRCLNYGPWYSGVNPFSKEGGLNRWKRKAKFKPAYLILASS